MWLQLIRFIPNPPCGCSGEESEDVTNDELPDERRLGIVGRHSSQPAMLTNLDATAGDMSDDLYSEINFRDTELLLKSRVDSKTRRATASTSESIYLVYLQICLVEKWPLNGPVCMTDLIQFVLVCKLLHHHFYDRAGSDCKKLILFSRN